MCGLKAAKMNVRPFRAAKYHVQSLAALDSFLLKRQKESYLTPFIIPAFGSAKLIPGSLACVLISNFKLHILVNNK